MGKFTDFVDNIRDEGGVLAKAELKKLVEGAKQDESEFVRLQAQNRESWTEMLADGDLTSEGFKKQVSKMEVLTELENIKLKIKAKLSA
ncbi:MAG: hypothetical protein OEZ10_08225 [Gammaproteobacteria bacterium]|nr:hypothetical protein [Gammaproteobacteria bacterium]